MCQKISVMVDGQEGISRLGGYGDDSLAGKCETQTVEGVIATVCWCNTDGCNGETGDGNEDGDNGGGDNGDGGNGARATALNAALVILGATCALFKLHA